LCRNGTELGDVISQIATYGRTAPTSGLMARAVTPAALAPGLRDRRQPQQPAHGAATVVLAPAAMTALIEAQEQLAEDAPRLVRQHAAQKIDHLINQLAEAPITETVVGAPFDVRQLQVVRDALSQGSVDLKA
jgi:hypothetical protein